VTPTHTRASLRPVLKHLARRLKQPLRASRATLNWQHKRQYLHAAGDARVPGDACGFANTQYHLGDDWARRRAALAHTGVASAHQAVGLHGGVIDGGLLAVGVAVVGGFAAVDMPELRGSRCAKGGLDLRWPSEVSCADVGHFVGVIRLGFEFVAVVAALRCCVRLV
jgi:hypothetical protein